MTKPKITIISCVWNLYKEKRVETFRQTMESVHNQSYDNIEHIIINNNSNDGTDKLIAEYIDKGWAKCFFHPVQGLWHAMNKGVEVAGGDYINFMNSDDYFVSEKSVEIAVREIVKTQADWFCADANRIFEDGRVGRWHIPDLNYIFMGACPNHQTMFVKTDIIREYGGFDLSFPLQCDDRMMLRLLQEKRKCAFLPKPIANFRQGGFSSGQNGYHNEYSQNFYNRIGKAWGMSFDDCFNLYQTHGFTYKNIKHVKKLAGKIQDSEWRASYLRRYRNYLSSVKQTTLYLFGFIPLLKKRWESDGACIYLFGCIPVLKKARS